MNDICEIIHKKHHQESYHDNIIIQSNLVNTTLIYTTPSILQHIFARQDFLVQNSLFYTTTTLDNVTLRISVLSY